MAFTSFGGTPPLQLQATTGLPGFTLQNATPTILSWTAPNDGNMHRLWIFGELLVSSTQTGGAVNLNIVDPTSTPRVRSIWSGNVAAGFGIPNNGAQVTIAPGTAVTLVQTAQTAGASVLYAELWGS
jgi:heme/copper-type cytochrome/quinol oxidase subunit 2